MENLSKQEIINHGKALASASSDFLHSLKGYYEANKEEYENSNFPEDGKAWEEYSDAWDKLEAEIDKWLVAVDA